MLLSSKESRRGSAAGSMLKAASFFDVGSAQLTHLSVLVSIRLCTNPLSVGVEEGLAGDLAGDPVAKNLDLERRTDLGPLGRDIGVRDRALDRVTVAAARHPADGGAVDSHGLGAERDRARVVQRDADKSPL